MSRICVLVLLALCARGMSHAAERLLLTNWRFHRGAAPSAALPAYDDSSWQEVRIPHDWAITGPFDREIDKQEVAVVQDGEKKATVKTGRTGALPWLGEGWYRTTLDIPATADYAELVFDGAMAEPQVYVNGKLAGQWAYGYNAFRVTITPFVQKGTRALLAVHLNNVPQSARWYPGAGLYRPVRLVTGQTCGLETWGTFARTTALDKDHARVTVTDAVRGAFAPKDKPMLRWSLRDEQGTVVATRTAPLAPTGEATAVLEVPAAKLWTPETPTLYTLESALFSQGRQIDTRVTRVGLRRVTVDANGFHLNGKRRDFKGVCLHHDLGPLGAAFNKAAFRRQVRLLKSIGCDAIRTSHNMPAPWQVDICDEMGMLVMAESFDEWTKSKCANGYSRFYRDWWVRDITNLILCQRNHPAIVMWSIGNEVPDQRTDEGLAHTRELQDLCHRLDPTRPVTQGLDNVDSAIAAGMLQAMDLPGLNYRLPRYGHAHTNAPLGLILGCETASTVSSRGVYKFPVKVGKGVKYADGQCSSYDVECCPWSNLPDEDWAMQEDHAWTCGEFVWTGFDYLGEPTPYNEYWPARSAYFGIFDLAGLPKDRAFLYRSHWNTQEPTLHIVPHWTFPGRVGEVTPVYCYTSYPSAELFVNGVSQGKRAPDPASLLDRFRLRWNDVVYRPGELRVVAYDHAGRPVAEKVTRTAQAPARLALAVDRARLAALQDEDSPDLAFVTVQVLDAQGTLCPDAALPLTFQTTGTVAYQGACNGDATSVEVFTQPRMTTFHGQLVVVIRASAVRGKGTLKVSTPNLPDVQTVFEVAD